MTTYCASYNVGNVEAWSSELYSDRVPVFAEIENSVDDIADAISGFSLLDEDEIHEHLKCAFVGLKMGGTYKDKDEQFDFFILEQPIYTTYSGGK